ncbi:TetR/AcrR family transcriptional regulator [Kitasatospora aureofaciens]|uniref:TetR family transcriptional regulator n=1 Tax=Kitasatospora aureofaciens TaxID=1894 RepID=A0A1E7N301_KITAU|nr:TetR/AcrR family transcriptional regulator [Kitasatospora aureofaciens]OEV35045.1 TetR family transcriptional regulator [Kitasatospora aureofaciens]QEU98082.1 TetR family transcriptional regulator [Streptomyces viridifaciens]UKZ03936.1 TetR/AcrR family transcriptional regulator [Streptomyces viridifaciens]GGU69533.1 TetR family transcriptional regulator [Kitasatospora aureofaciens]
MTEATGRRERKKAQTRQALADAALELFLERGYDQVGVKDVADAADVSVTTLFKHFPGKEALVFDQDDDLEAALVAAVRERPPGRSVPEALREHLLLGQTRFAVHSADPRFAAFLRMVQDTPALRDYAHRMWTRHEAALAAAIAEAAGAPRDDVRCAALARFALEARSLIQRHPDPARAADEVFALLEHGWTASHQGT